ncbi:MULTISPECIES: hypothetical protein [unclassified Wolbachia]|uniref:hypothetical protein n=1 Tax=unclassified Wolbachia TaxID=2640676 RepID=UPI00222E3696|nr:MULTISPECIES: hypothetical protein [unclassified Wolbachia]
MLCNKAIPVSATWMTPSWMKTSVRCLHSIYLPKQWSCKRLNDFAWMFDII